MAPLGTLSQAWVSAEALLPLGWQISGLWRFGELWVSWVKAPFEETTPVAQVNAITRRYGG